MSTDPRIDILGEQMVAMWARLDEGSREALRPGLAHVVDRLDGARDIVPADAVTTVFLAADARYWRDRYHHLDRRVRHAADVLTDGQNYYFGESAATPPEPPVGTVYVDPADGGMVVWTRRDDGWHCSRDECQNCPAEWGEVEQRLSTGADRTLERRLPHEQDDYSKAPF